MTETVDLILLPRWILPIRPTGLILEHHALVIHQGRIIDLCPADRARQDYQARDTLSLPEQVLMPGLVNAHGHAAMSLFRGLADDLPLMDWLNHHIWPAESRWVSEDFVRTGVQLAIHEMLCAGTTTFSDMYFFPEVTAAVAVETGMRCQVAVPILDFPTPWGSGPDDYLRKGLALIDDYRLSERITVAFGPHAPYTVSDGPLSRIVTLANQLDCPIQIHLHETAFEVEDATRRLGQRPIVRMDQLGLLTPATQCVHMTQISEDDLRLLQRSGAHVIHCPQSNLKLASGFCPTARLLEAGVNVALGTDGAASNNDLDLWDEMRTAALLAKAVAGDAAAVPALRALEMATLGGARALGLEGQIGTLEIGKQADCIAVDLSPLQVRPLYHLPSQLVYAARASQVSHAWIKGQLVLQQGIPTRIDTRQLRTDVECWQEKIRPGG